MPKLDAVAMSAFWRYQKAGLFGLFVCLAISAGAPSSMAESLLDQLKRLENEAPPPPTTPPTPQKSIQPPLRLQIEQASPGFDERTKEPIVTFRLTERSGRMFAEFTKSNIGRTVEIRIDGKAIMRPIIREPIAGGSVQVSGGFTLNEAKELVDRLNSGAARVEAEVVD